MKQENLLKYSLNYLGIALLTAIIWMQPFSGGGRVPGFILILVGLLLLIWKKFSLHDLRWKQLNAVIACLWLPALISMMGGYTSDSSIAFLVVLPLFSLFAIANFYILDRYLNLETLSKITVIICGIWLVDALVQFLFGMDLLGKAPLDDGRISGPFNHLRLGLFLSVLLPITLSYLNKYGYKYQLSYLFLVILMTFSTGVRTDLVTILLALGLYVLANKKIKLLLFLVPVFLLSGTIMVSQSDIANTKAQQTIQQLPSNYQEWNLLLSHRLDIWSAAWAMLKDNPVHGVGVKGFDDAYSDYSTEHNAFHSENAEAYHAHHPIISIAAETGLSGLVGLVLIAALLFKWGKSALGSMALFKNPWAQTLVLIFFPLQSMPILFKLWWFPFVLLILVCYIHSLHTEAASRDE